MYVANIWLIYYVSNRLRLIASLANLYPLYINNNDKRNIYYLSAFADIGNPKHIFDQIEKDKKYIKFDNHTLKQLNVKNDDESFGIEVTTKYLQNITQNLEIKLPINIIKSHYLH